MLPKSNIMLLDRIGPKSMVPLSELNKFLEKGVITRRARKPRCVSSGMKASLFQAEPTKLAIFCSTTSSAYKKQKNRGDMCGGRFTIRL